MEKVIGVVVILAVPVIVSALLIAIPMYYLWNWLMPEIFGLTTLTFVEALGLSMLAACLFGRSISSSSKS